jgi:hypothetical protein
MPKPALTLAAFLSLGASIAIADEEGAMPRTAEVIDTGGGGVRGVAQEWMVLPSGQELGVEMRLLTAKPMSLGTDELAFTDVALLGLRARTALGMRSELSASIDVLPKQPSYTEELIWQGASLGLKTQPVKSSPIALGLKASGGPMLGELGWWGSGSVGINARKRLHEIMTFQGAFNALGTYLLPRDAADDPAWILEAAVSGSVLFRDPKGWTGAWFGFGYSVPLADKGREPMTDAALDPQPRLDLHLGSTLSFVERWDVFVDFAIIDRGDMPAMGTRLPILDGGFDQRQVIFGVNYHVKKKDMATPSAMIMY